MASPQWTALWKSIGRKLLGGFSEGYGRPSASPQDKAFFAQIKQNLYWFSGMKSYQVMMELNALLRDGDKLREWKEFRARALEVNAQYNQRWLKTEYDTAVGQAQMAARWRDEYWPNEATHYLVYQTASDERVRSSHKALDGITLPANDPFWNRYYPPWAWACRCDVTMVARAVAQPSVLSGVELPENTGYLANAGKSGEVFSEAHPYFDAPGQVKLTVKNRAKDA